MTDTQIATCKGKKKYLTYEHAKADAESLRKYYNVTAHVYHCRYCNHWHVGGSNGLDR